MCVCLYYTHDAVCPFVCLCMCFATGEYKVSMWREKVDGNLFYNWENIEVYSYFHLFDLGDFDAQKNP